MSFSVSTVHAVCLQGLYTGDIVTVCGCSAQAAQLAAEETVATMKADHHRALEEASDRIEEIDAVAFAAQSDLADQLGR